MIEVLRQTLATDVSWLWISARTLGIAAWLASSVTVIVGLVISTRLASRPRSVRLTNTVHRSAATLTLAFVIGHILTLIPDPYAKLTLLDSLIPGQAPNNTIATALGTIAFLALALVALGGTVRSHLGRRTWKAIHSVAFVVWPLASIHFIVMGTDVLATWSLAMIAVVAGLIVLLLVRRGYAPSRREPQHATGAIPGAIPGLPRATNSVELTVASVIAETADAKTIVFDIADKDVANCEYLPGQHLTLRVPSSETGSVARCYSLSSAPGVDRNLRITVKRTSNGYASNWLCDNAAPGMRLQALSPAGTFHPTDGMGDLLLFAGGSGITPLMSMIKSALAEQSRRIVLVYANRDEDSIIFAKELRELQRRQPYALNVHHWVQAFTGIPTANDVVQALAHNRDSEIFVCGPGPFMRLVADTAGEFGWPKERIHIEEFRSLTGDPFQPQRLAASTRTASKTNTATLTKTAVVHVELDGQSHTVGWPEDSSLVEALHNAGVDAPYSCLEGVCATCECKLVSGSVASDSSVHREGDRVLGCQIRPTSEIVQVKF